jgi:hypothetical protein
MGRQWRRGSEFGPGRRVPLTEDQKREIMAKAKLVRYPGGLTHCCIRILGEFIAMIGADGRLDPSHEAIAKRIQGSVSSVKENLNRLQEFGFLDWTCRVVRSGSGVQQTTNAYVLLVPGAEATFPRGVLFNIVKKHAPRQRRQVIEYSTDQATAFMALATKAAASQQRANPAWLARRERPMTL